MAKKEAALYLRVSTQEQANEGYSIPEQEHRLKMYCEAMGWDVFKIYTDAGYSGSNTKRPALNEMKIDINNGLIDIVAVYKLDRLSRSQRDTIMLIEDVFLKNNIDFVSMSENFDTSTPFGRATIGILSVFSQLERENIRERTMMGRQARIRSGRFHGSHAPFGYKFQPGTNNLEIDEYYADMVREIFSLYLSGKGGNSIARTMDSKYGSNRIEWNNTSIRRILRNPVYAGIVTLADKKYTGTHTPIITENDFITVAAILKYKKSLDKRSYKYSTGADNILTGLLFCGDCGARMYARKVSKITKKYMCHSVARTSKAMIKSDSCSNRLHPLTVKELDSIICKEILKLSLDRTQYEKMLKKQKHITNTQGNYQERIKIIEMQIERIMKLYQTGIIEMEEIQERLHPLKDERSKLLAHIQKTTSPAQLTPDRAWKTICTFEQIVSDGTPEELHRVIHTLIDKIVVLNDSITIYWSFC